MAILAQGDHHRSPHCQRPTVEMSGQSSYLDTASWNMYPEKTWQAFPSTCLVSYMNFQQGRLDLHRCSKCVNDFLIFAVHCSPQSQPWKMDVATRDLGLLLQHSLRIFLRHVEEESTLRRAESCRQSVQKAGDLPASRVEELTPSKDSFGIFFLDFAPISTSLNVKPRWKGA